ncbi:MAG: DUF1461 domain-containing protein [Chloroflexi bacterium]|nr:DUF1461 domain-containing protein [Chloroflexota bacterium]
MAWLRVAGSIAFVLGVPVLLVLTNVRSLVYDPRLYERGYERYGVAATTGMSREQLRVATEQMMAYFERGTPVSLRIVKAALRRPAARRPLRAGIRPDEPLVGPATSAGGARRPRRRRRADDAGADRWPRPWRAAQLRYALHALSPHLVRQRRLDAGPAHGLHDPHVPVRLLARRRARTGGDDDGPGRWAHRGGPVAATLGARPPRPQILLEPLAAPRSPLLLAPREPSLMDRRSASTNGRRRAPPDPIGECNGGCAAGSVRQSRVFDRAPARAARGRVDRRATEQ